MTSPRRAGDEPQENSWCSGAFDVCLPYSMYDVRQRTQVPSQALCCTSWGAPGLILELLGPPRGSFGTSWGLLGSIWTNLVGWVLEKA